MNTKKDEITIKKLAEIFLPTLWIIVLTAVVCAALLGAYSMFIQKDQFSASGKFMVIKIPYDDDDSKTTGLNSNEILAMQGMIANAKEIINTRDFCQSVKDSVETDLTAKQLMSTMSVSLCNTDTTCYFFDVTAKDPDLAYKIADVAGELLRQKFVDMGYAIRIERIDTPVVPGEADDKNVLRNAVIGFAVGMVLSTLVIFVNSKFDVIIRSKEKLENSFDIPILGVIPKPENSKAYGRRYGEYSDKKSNDKVVGA